MKKLFGFVLVCVVSAALTVCDDSSSKGGGKAASGTFTKAYSSTLPAENSALFSEADAKIQYLYLASDINGSGFIKKIRVQQGTPLASSETTCDNVTIKMGHTDLTTLGTTWAENVETGQGSEVTVLDNKTVRIPAAAANSWIDIALDTPFNYNGKDNLIVDFERTSGCSADVPTNITNVPNRVAADIVTDSVPGMADWNATTASGSYSDPLCMQFVFTGGDDKLEYATTGQPLPFMASSDIRQQMLYKADDINGSGVITGVGFALATSPASDCNYTVTVRLGHTNLDELGTTTFEGNYSGSSTIVANAASFEVPANAAYASYVWLPLSRSFNYDGSSNLIVDVDVSDGSAGMNLRCDDLGLNTRVYSLSGGALTSSNHRFAVKFRFAGGTADVIGSGNHNLWPPFHGTITGQFQPLYIASELGLNGSIKSIGFRLQNDSVAESYGNISIAIGHSDLATLVLGPLYLDNMYDEKTVFTGTVSVPAGLKAGDWVDIPLESTFRCTPGKNLAIYVRHDAGASAIENFVQGENDSDKYPGRLLGTENQTLDQPGWVADILPSIRLGLK